MFAVACYGVAQWVYSPMVGSFEKVLKSVNRLHSSLSSLRCNYLVQAISNSLEHDAISCHEHKALPDRVCISPALNACHPDGTANSWSTAA